MSKIILFDLDSTLLQMNQDEFLKCYFSDVQKIISGYGYDSKEFMDVFQKSAYSILNSDGIHTNEELFWKAFSNKYDDLDKINSLSFLDDVDQYKKYNEELRTAIKASNNLTLYKDILSMPYAKLYNDTLFVDVDYTDYDNSSNLYLCIATPRDAVSHIPIRKIKFTSENNLQLNKYETSVLKNKYYLIWIQDDNFNNISPSFILSTYDNDKDIQDYYRNECKKYLYDKYDLIDLNSKHKQYFHNVIFALLSESDIRYKDIDYYFLQTLLALYQDNLGTLHMDDMVFLISNVLFNNNYANNIKVKLYDNTISIDESDGFNIYMSCINITQSDIIKNKLHKKIALYIILILWIVVAIIRWIYLMRDIQFCF